MRKYFAVFFLLTFTTILFAQKEDKKEESRQEFKVIYQVKTTPVKSQDRTGTCWSFATMSFVETELLRMGHKELNLSEMFNVRKMFSPRAKMYVRMHGEYAFGTGGQAHDVMNVIKKYGIVPEEAYTGNNIEEDKHNHGEMMTVIKSMLDAVIKNRGKKLTPRWEEAFNAVLDIYMGKAPDKFTYEGKEYTPASFRDELGFNPDDYIEFTSYSHHPYYEKFALEIPDNWSYSNYYNVPMNDMIEIFKYALENGYSIAWDGDVSEKEFSMQKGYAIIPQDENDEGEGPEKEKEITEEMRQKSFDNYTTTDDHLMHIVGLAENQNGDLFYLTKNSWGTRPEKFKYDGYIYMSEPFVKLKTVAFMVHKDAVPKEILEKLK